MTRAVRRAGFVWSYDSSADTLHISMDPSCPVYGDPLRNLEGIVIVMRRFEDNQINGLRILGAREHGLQELKILLDREKRAIAAFKVSGRIPKWTPDEQDEELTREISEVKRILEDEPEEIRELLACC